MKKISIGVLISALSAWGLTAAETVYTVDNANTIGFYNAQVNIGRIDIVQTGTTGRMRIEQPNGVYNVTNGIHLADGARLSYWAGKSTAGVFGGGLKLADGVNAKVAKYSDQGYLCALSALGAEDNAQKSVWSYPYAAMNFFNYVVSHGNCNAHGGVHAQGQRPV